MMCDIGRSGLPDKHERTKDSKHTHDTVREARVSVCFVRSQVLNAV